MVTLSSEVNSRRFVTNCLLILLFLFSGSSYALLLKNEHKKLYPLLYKSCISITDTNLGSQRAFRAFITDNPEIASWLDSNCTRKAWWDFALLLSPKKWMDFHASFPEYFKRLRAYTECDLPVHLDITKIEKLATYQQSAQTLIVTILDKRSRLSNILINNSEYIVSTASQIGDSELNQILLNLNSNSVFEEIFCLLEKKGKKGIPFSGMLVKFVLSNSAEESNLLATTLSNIKDQSPALAEVLFEMQPGKKRNENKIQCDIDRLLYDLLLYPHNAMDIVRAALNI